MPIFALAFGSFGDFVTVLQLAFQLRTQLNDASSSTQIVELIADIDVFTRAVLLISSTVEHRRAQLPSDVINGIVHALAVCKGILEDVQQKALAQRRKCNLEKGVAFWWQLWSVAAWSILGGSTEIDRLRTRLHDQVELMQTYLALSQCHDQAAIRGMLHEQHARLDLLFSAVQAVPAHAGVETPRFLFRDAESGSFYQPCARTSVQRLLDLSDAMRKTHPLRQTFRLGSILNPDWLRNQARSLTTGRQNCFGLPSLVENHLHLLVDSFIFFSDFQQLQVLVGMRPNQPYVDVMEYEDIQRCLKVLLERRHSIGLPCNCDGMHCGVRFENMAFTAERFQELINPYETVASLIRQRVGDDILDCEMTLLLNRIPETSIQDPELVNQECDSYLRAVQDMRPCEFYPQRSEDRVFYRKGQVYEA